jgi:histidine ammonia-lyase
MTLTVRGPGDLGLEAVERIAFAGERVTLTEDALDAVRASRAQAVAVLDRGERVYGVNTGLGYRSSQDVVPADQEAHETRLILGRAVGSAPYLPPSEARAVLAVRLAGFLTGRAGVTAELCVHIAACLNTGFTPAIPRDSIGCAGEIIPLAHAFGALMGVGSVVEADGSAAPAGAALALRGLAPLRPARKEGIALLGGAPGAIALGAARLREAWALAGALLVSAAAAADAASAPTGPYDPALGRIGGDPLLEGVLIRFHRLVTGGGPARVLQAPVSFRVAPQVLTHLERAIARLEEDLRRALVTVTDSPALLEGRFVSNGGFHQVEAAAGMDALTAATARAGEVAVQRTHRLLDERFTGLPDQLAPGLGAQAGLVAVHKRAVGSLGRLRSLATPASVGAADTSLGQEDAMTFAFDAAERLRMALTALREIAACELLTARQAWWLRQQVSGEDPAPGLAAVAALLADTVPPVREDRPLGDDVARIDDLLRNDGLGTGQPGPDTRR